MAATLNRQVFETSRLLEFFNEKELQMQIGHDKRVWAIALVKELIDNGLDACESAKVAPAITVTLEHDAVTVADNGPGLPGETIRKSLDYSVRVSSNNHYIAPTRGQLGNALKTVWAAPFAVSGDRGVVEVSTAQRHCTIDVTLDRIAQTPVLSLSESEPIVKKGTSVKMHWTQVAGYLEPDEPASFYNDTPSVSELLQNFALFNPHAEFALGNWTWSASATDWQKWTPTLPTSPHWYTVENLRNLAAAYLSTGDNKTVREFVKEFRGLSGTARQKSVTDCAGLSGKTLGDLVVDGDLAVDALSILLTCMQSESRPVQPDLLGVIGETHIRRWLTEQHVSTESIEYRCKRGVADGLPYVLEMAFGVSSNDDSRRRVAAGLNWTPSVRVPFETLNRMMSECLVQYNDPVIVVIHLACPKLAFTDRGKSRLMLPNEISNEFANAFKNMTKRFTKAKRDSAKQERMSARQLNDLRKRETRQLSTKEACYAIMDQAYNRASSNGLYPANARQVMYAARKFVKNMGVDFFKNSATFTQQVLPDYQTEYPHLTAGWDVVYDDRGHLIEPHTDREIGLGTVSVRRYISEWTNGTPPRVEDIRISQSVPTVGPHNRYGAVLFVEKEGFNELLRIARIADRYDIAIESTKGQTVTAARLLAEHYARQGVPIFVLHDFDKSGLEIVAAYRNDNRRYQYDTRPLIYDIGLRLSDVIELGLEEDGAEEVLYHSKVHPKHNLIACGATPEEVRYLVRGGYPKAWHGNRVELNALTSEQFVRLIERKLDEHGVKKVIPDSDTYLEAAYRRSFILQKMQKRIDEIYADVVSNTTKVEIPANLRQQLELRIHGSSDAWDAIVKDIAGEHATN